MKRTELIMGMPITISLVGSMDDALVEDAFDHFRQVDVKFSTYKADSEISRLNRGDIKLDEASEELQLVLADCEMLKHKSRGFFNIERNGQIDPSGYVKGWAIGQVAKGLAAKGVKNFFIDAGGDIFAAGHNEQGQPWRVGIKHPRRPSKLTKVVGLSNLAIATSGTYERGRHIYNPHNGLAVTGLLSLSVIGPDIVEADVLATAAFAMGPVQGLKYIAESGLTGMAITEAEQVLTTAGFERYCLV